jgi:hypothetical protein
MYKLNFQSKVDMNESGIKCKDNASALEVAIIRNQPHIVKYLIEIEALKDLIPSTSKESPFQLACCYGRVEIFGILCRCCPREILLKCFETLYNTLMTPTVSKDFPAYPRKLEIVRDLCRHLFLDDPHNKRFIDYIQKQFYGAYYRSDAQLMTFLCSIFPQFSPHQWYSLHYQKYMSSVCFSASEVRFIIPNNRSAFMFLLEVGMSEFGEMTEIDFQNIYRIYESRPSVLFNDILRSYISESLFVQKSIKRKFSSDICPHIFVYAGIPHGASLESVKAVLNFYKMNFFLRT